MWCCTFSPHFTEPIMRKKKLLMRNKKMTCASNWQRRNIYQEEIKRKNMPHRKSYFCRVDAFDSYNNSWEEVEFLSNHNEPSSKFLIRTHLIFLSPCAVYLFSFFDVYDGVNVNRKKAIHMINSSVYSTPPLNLSDVSCITRGATIFSQQGDGYLCHCSVLSKPMQRAAISDDRCRSLIRNINCHFDSACDSLTP
eukprot:XP_002260552.1 hypothetical protein PKH_130340 [Plasmodium knowlesi strain H]